MKYKIGDALENDEWSMVIDSIVGTVYVCICSTGSIYLHRDQYFEKHGYKLKTKEAPKDGVAVIVTCIAAEAFNTPIYPVDFICISAGTFDEDGDLNCYNEGFLKGEFSGWKTWRIYK